MMRVSGVEPVRTLTEVAADAVTGTSETTRKIATSRNRDFWAKLSLQSQGARGFDAQRLGLRRRPHQKYPIWNSRSGGPGWDRTNDQPIMSRPGHNAVVARSARDVGLTRVVCSLW